MMRITPIMLALGLTMLFACGEEEPITDDTMDEQESFARYSGKWNGNLGFNNVDISAIVDTVGTNKFEGPFFISSSYRPCCGVEHDGKISFVMEGDSLLNFKWNDEIPECEGTFTGKGVVKEGNLEINITGRDCDGDHVATLSLIRRN